MPVSDKSEFAKQIKVQRNRARRDYSLMIDGQEFPWYISDDGLRVQVDRDGSPAVRLTLLAEEVLVEDRLGTASDRPEPFVADAADATLGAAARTRQEIRCQ